MAHPINWVVDESGKRVVLVEEALDHVAPADAVLLVLAPRHVDDQHRELVGGRAGCRNLPVQQISFNTASDSLDLDGCFP